MPELKKSCTDCGREFERSDDIYTCPKCSIEQPLNESPLGLVRIEYSYSSVKRFFTPEMLSRNEIKSQGRYIHLLPLDSVSSLPPLEVGPTPLHKVERLRRKLGLKHLFIKDDTCLPTGSFKDRASSIVVAKARELGRDVVATASTGNAATALAGMSASVGLKSVIFVPESAPPAKLTQIAMFGATLIPIKGTYDDAVSLCLEACCKFGWYNRNTGYNPYTVEGKKTAALEIWEQLGYRAPDKVFIPTGDGVILSGTYKGFYDLKMMGLIGRIPQLIPVQAEGSAAIVGALEAGRDTVVPISESRTIADSIAVSSPAAGRWALKVVRETGGFGIKVSDGEILAAMKELASNAGVFAEPAASAAFAGLIRGVKNKRVDADETVVVLITGTGLKDVPAAQKVITIPDAIEPRLDNINIAGR